jgi:hypothetical protein
MTSDHLLAALRSNVESTLTRADGSTWGCVYLDNAYADATLIGSRHEFAGYLSALTAQGVYRPIDKQFGDVRLA